MARKSFLRWLYSGYDWPIYSDWLAYVGLALTGRNLWRGYHDPVKRG